MKSLSHLQGFNLGPRSLFAIRQATLTASIPYYTTVSGARAAAAAIAALAARPLEVRSLQAYFNRV